MSYDVERNIDAIEVEVFSNRILAIIEEMGAKLVRSSFPQILKNAKIVQWHFLMEKVGRSDRQRIFQFI